MLKYNAKNSANQDGATALYYMLKLSRELGQVTVRYSDLMRAMHVGPSVLWTYLSIVQRYCHEHRETPITAMAVGESGKPGKGFFELARDLGEPMHTPQEEEHYWRSCLRQLSK